MDRNPDHRSDLGAGGEAEPYVVNVANSVTFGCVVSVL